MKVLLLDAFDGDDPIVAASVETLEAGGHVVEVIDLAGSDFTIAMSTEERRAYHDEGANLLVEETRAGAEAVRSADALLFCYLTTTFTLPARLKAFLDRVLIPDVAFGFDHKGRVTGKLTNIRRLGIVTRRPHGRWSVARARDGGRRTVMWTVRLNCHRLCRRTFVALDSDETDLSGVRRRLGRW